MPWYLWQRGEYVPDYSIGKNEACIKLHAKTLEEAKDEVGLYPTETDVLGGYDGITQLVRMFKNNRYEYVIGEAKLFFVEQEIDLEPEILAAQKKIQELQKQIKTKQEKEARYQEYLKLQAEFQK